MKFNKSNIFIGKQVKLGKNVEIGDNTIIYDNVTIGDNTIISNNCVIGEPANAYYRDRANYQQKETIIGENSLIRSHTIIYAGNQLGHHFSTGHFVVLRENNTFGHHCSVGTRSEMYGDVEVGNYARFNSNISLGRGTKVGDFVLLAPYVGTTDDPLPPSNIALPVEIGDFSILAAHVIMAPAIKVGRHCLLGLRATVTRDIPDYSIAFGTPARRIKDIRKLKSPHFEGHYYPWMYHFTRGLPWHEIGFDAWAMANGVEIPPKLDLAATK